jgi:hypothetical protein
LKKVAINQAQVQAKRHEVTHDNPLGDFKTRTQRLSSNVFVYGEICAPGNNFEEAMNSWSTSKDHWVQIIDPKNTIAGGWGTGGYFSVDFSQVNVNGFKEPNCNGIKYRTTGPQYGKVIYSNPGSSGSSGSHSQPQSGASSGSGKSSTLAQPVVIEHNVTITTQPIEDDSDFDPDMFSKESESLIEKVASDLGKDSGSTMNMRAIPESSTDSMNNGLMNSENSNILPSLGERPFAPTSSIQNPNFRLDMNTNNIMEQPLAAPQQESGIVGF